MCAVSPPKVPADLIRGIPAHTLMQQACRCLDSGSKGPNVEQRWYDHSSPTERLTHFLSHSWQDGRFDKALALMLYNSQCAIYLSTSFVVALVALVQGFDLLPLPKYSFYMEGILSTNGISCLVCGCLAWCLTPAAPCVHGEGAWFLDKACICQHDPALKQQGILALGCFLQRSERMVILLSPRYFVRGWCAFEVATFIAHKDLQAVDIVPLLRAKMVASTFGLNVLALTIFHVMTSLKITELEGGEVYGCFALCVPLALVLGCMSYLVEKYLREQEDILRQIGSFSFADAKFTEEADRANVSQSINTLFGSVADFETVVRTDVLEKVTRVFGDERLPLRYEAFILGTVPYMWWGIDMCCTDAPQLKVMDFIVGSLSAFSIPPVLFRVSVELVRCKLLLFGGEAADWVKAAAGFGVFAGMAVLTCICGALTLLSASVSPLLTCALWAIVSAVCFAPRRPTRKDTLQLLSQREV